MRCALRFLRCRNSAGSRSPMWMPERISMPNVSASDQQMCPWRAADYADSSDVRSVRRAAKNSDQEFTSGCCLSNARRWRSVMPPHTPNSIWLSSASARHSMATGHDRQIAAACLCAAPRTNRSSGLVKRHRACDTQPMRERKRARGAGRAGVTRSSYQQSHRIPPHRQLVDES